MKIKNVLFVLGLSSSWFATSYYFDQMIMPAVNPQDPCWQMCYQDIELKNPDALSNLIEKWNGVLQQSWHKINELVLEEIGMSAYQLCHYLHNESFNQEYMNHYRQECQDFINNPFKQDIPAIVSNFIQLKFLYTQLNKSVYINSCNDMNLLTSSFGTNMSGYYFMFNDMYYNPETITKIYQAAADHDPMFYIKINGDIASSEIIEMQNLLHLGITQSLSNVLHQSDAFIKLIMVINFDNQGISEETQKYSMSHLVFLSYLEAALQSKNPLEAALYLQHHVDGLHAKFILLWQDFIQDIKDCYQEEYVQLYQDVVRSKFKIAMCEA